MFRILALGLLTACASPSLDYLGTSARPVTVDGVRFSVHVMGRDAQVIRLDRLRRTDRAAMPARMVRAAELASGCAVIDHSLTPSGGPHSAVARVGLRCG